jgi:phenylalanyl-tRNA synthetase alpha chain
MATSRGHAHPISQAISDINAIFSKIGFSLAEGPLIESEHYNFDALNVPRDHPARDMQDTFWIKERQETVLRTHTSPVQVRYMEKHRPPIRIIAPGRVYRNEATDATHEAQFFQLEGLAVDTHVTLGHLKGTIEHFFSVFFGGEIKTRFRPGYFPFVEPGVEVDMYWKSARGERWVELMGAGMVHPNTLKASGINPDKYQGFAFGVGIERLLAVKYGIEDVRLFHNGDLRFVNQF